MGCEEFSPENSNYSKVSPHRGSQALRHAWATRMLSAGRPLKVIADLLGHRQINTTSIYAKVDLGQLRQMALPWPEGMSR